MKPIDDQQFIRMLAPRALPPTPEGIKANVLRAIRRKKQRTLILTTMKRISLPFAAAASIALGVMLFGRPTHGFAAGQVIDHSLAAAGGVQSMTMTIDVRTEPNESFAYTNPFAPMVEHTLTLLRTPGTMWRLEKPGRTIVFDGSEKFLWYAGNSLGVRAKADAGLEEWFAVLLDPEQLLRREKATLQAEGARYRLDEVDGRIVLTAKVKARGDFSASSYGRGSSIEESNTRRELRFDKVTGVLRGAKIWVGPRLIVEIKNIEYNGFVDPARLVALPEGMEWRDIDAPVGTQFAGITPEEAARRILTAFAQRDPALAQEALSGYGPGTFERYLGIGVVEVGEAFRSGTYAGVFVPCKIRMPNGRVKKHNISLRNDNATQAWVLDGGL